MESGTATLKDATSEAIRDWVTNVETTHYILGSAAGPHPYPAMVREFQAVIGREVRAQALEKWGGKPDVLLACIGGGSNSIGLFHEFVEDDDVRLIGAFCPPKPRLLVLMRQLCQCLGAVPVAVLCWAIGSILGWLPMLTCPHSLSLLASTSLAQCAASHMARRACRCRGSRLRRGH